MSDVRPLVLPNVAAAQAPPWLQPASVCVRPLTFREGAPPAPTLPPEASAPPARSEPTPPPDPQPSAHEAWESAVARREARLVETENALVAERARLEQAQRETMRERERFAAAIAELAAARAHIVTEMQAPLLELAVGIAEAITVDALRREPERHEAIVLAALEPLGSTRDARVRLGREAHDAIVLLNGAPEVHVNGSSVPCVLDPSLVELGCIVEAGRARVDARLSERLGAVLEALDHARRAAEAP